MESRSGPNEKEPLSIERHHGAVTTIRRVETASTGSLAATRSPPPTRSSDGRTGTAGRTQTGDSSSQHLQEPPPSRRGRKGFTVHWPFQSIATDTLSIFTSPAPELFRRATWQPPKIHDENDSVVSPRDSTLIPDYVVNFIRGETPETVARRKRNGGHQGMRAVDVTHQHKPQRSHMALLEGDGGARRNLGYARSHASGSTNTSTTTERQQILPDSEKPRHGWKRVTTGWRSGVLLNLLLILAILIIGFVCLVIAGTKIAILVGDMNLFIGSCATAASINWGLHALINVVVVILIVGANYVFQVLSSPKRSEISGAHESRKWLEIGVPSARNFRHIGAGRAFLALVLLTVAVVTQIIYNSLIFTTSAGFDYDLVAVDASFVTGGQFSNASSSNSAGLSRDELVSLQNLASQGGLNNLSTSACIDLFSGAFNADYQAILLVLSGESTTNSLVATAHASFDDSPKSNFTSTAGSEILVDGSAVTYCLAEAADLSEATCTVHLNGILFAVVLGLNLLSFLLTGATLLLRRFEPLVTLGDAIASFLRDPDPSTRNNSLLTKENVRTGMGGWGFTEGKYWSPTRSHFWFRSPSLSQWLTAGFWWLATAGLVTGVLVLAVTSHTPVALSSFGVPDAHSTYLVPATTPAAALAIVSAIPQLLLAGLYFSTNALLTAYFLSRESAKYVMFPSGIQRLPLRVSADPVGYQTTSLYLTLPRPASWALALWFAAMGFVLSQACFVVSLQSSSSSAAATAATAGQHIRGVGFSGVALLILLAMLVVLLLVVVGIGFLRAPSQIMADGRAVGNPLVFEGGSCSAVMSARCHRVPCETDAWKNCVVWGVVPELGDSPVSHVTYSARPMAEMDTCHRYV